jgi:hypothetical protein
VDWSGRVLLTLAIPLCVLALGWWVVARMIPPVPDCSRPLAFAISTFAMLGVAAFTFVFVGPLLITEAGESPSPMAVVVGLVAGTFGAAPFVGFAVLLAVLGSRR